MGYCSKLLPLVLALCLVASSCTTEALKTKVTRLQFFLHDNAGIPNPDTILVARRLDNFNSSDPVEAAFGNVFVRDNPLTLTPDINSKLIGRSQGIAALSSHHNERSLLNAVTFVFNGAFNGSSVSVVGRNPVLNEVRELPIVGGTGIFRLATGFMLLRTHSITPADAVIGYNVTIIHYPNLNYF
ncbi:Dirigent protein [Quillaja saponaria]|uniref:Dirigent protein n=1 Tax=Quillaja saponaria TaxID=32244 RepID=A0AAD7LE75_QUISA|nr:Dirigent protein [Quillaja saponaria]